MNIRKYFPLGKAYGKAFCNRETETQKLVGNIQSGKHTVLVAPRRYGKSSLCEKALDICQLPTSVVDFHLAVSEKNIERFILKGVVDLIGKSISQVDKMTALIKKTVKNLKPRFEITTGPLSLSFDVSDESTAAENISEALLLLEKLLQEKNKTAVLLFDEFQEVGKITNGKGAEGAIRHVAQETQNLALIFSGSNPHLINNMFENESRPLYKLCKKLPLHRISAEHYKKHLNYAAKQQWSQQLSDETFTEIISLTERHPYYMNALCDEIWAESQKIPSTEMVKACWQIVIESDKSHLIKDFLRLSDNQRKALIHISTYGGKELFSSKSIKSMDIPSGSLMRAVSTLLENDFIEQANGKYHLIIPIYRNLLTLN
ncbi:MAG: ATP-binding protein [Coxiellaceae bacterium]|nr:ATP-binding protein [Coxiellaceae bacterium]